MLSHAFTVLSLYGLWKSENLTSSWISKIYAAYRYFVIVILYSYCLRGSINIIESSHDLKDITNNSFLLMATIGALYKANAILVKRGYIIKFRNILKNDLCRPRDNEENSMQDSCDNDGCHTPLTQILFGYVYVLFSIGGFASAAFGVDTLTFGMMMDICTQLKILRYRLKNVPRSIEKIVDMSRSNGDAFLPKLRDLECNMLGECIRHHCNIFELADLLNATFSSMIFSQFAISSSVFCFTVFELTKLPLFSLGFVYTAVYFSCMMTQIFLYCWFGNNVILQSVDVANAVYEMDWSSLSISSQKMLVMILIRALKPIQLTSGYVIVLSIDSYNNLMKSSYSVYNVLSRSSE